MSCVLLCVVFGLFVSLTLAHLYVCIFVFVCILVCVFVCVCHFCFCRSFRLGLRLPMYLSALGYVLVLVFAYVLCIDVCSLCSYCVSHLRSSHSLCLRVRLYLGVCILAWSWSMGCLLMCVVLPLIVSLI
jgi:hypothetical protein